MRRLVFILSIALCASAHAQTKISELPTTTTATTDDIIPIVDSPASGAATKKIAVGDFAGSLFLLKTTTDLAEGTNLYWTAARFNSAFGAKSTSDLPEGSNLYYTAARFNSAFGGKTTTDLSEGSNLYWTSGRFDTAFAGKSTTNLSEGTNLYWTQGRFDTAFGGKSTTSLTEGSNLYFTDARARASFTFNAPISFNSGTGALSITQADASHNGYLSQTDWSTFNGKGSVSSVGLTVPGIIFSVSGSPITTSGTLAFSLLNQSANTIFAGPTSGGSASPTFRPLVAGDIPSLTASKISDFNSSVDARLPVMGTGGYYLPPANQVPTSNVSVTVSANNQVRTVAFVPPVDVPVNSIHFNLVTASAGGLCGVGVYSGDGNTKLIDSGAKSTTSTGVQSTTLGATVTLKAGTLYFLAYTADNTTAALTGLVAQLTNATNVLNTGTVQTGIAANSSASGVLPTTLGTITASNIGLAFVKLQK